jgi:hypothetical protein
LQQISRNLFKRIQASLTAEGEYFEHLLWWWSTLLIIMFD